MSLLVELGIKLGTRFYSNFSLALDVLKFGQIYSSMSQCLNVCLRHNNTNRSLCMYE